ncbi:MAG TPA: helix-turn-helix transcriptional regulator [Ramlibacter sp.]|uniref:helix-turn-helix domain-containing protein n=1 Tax=Ramlibacter sp. TaxID=1917967 RepID=UPI002D80F3F2|nr:helix-turn-helix transcriptional regulator [Ramlibacter sp.]HET8745695.1 helix-turn-helix transcriptional regulator [Ramlibacter sp.]
MAKKPSKALTVLAENLDRLIAARQAREPQFTQPMLAKLAKVDQKTVWRIVHKQNEPSIDKLEKIANVLQVETWHLLVPDLDPAKLPELAREEAAV